jgi:abortive infection bacteriophage resistance protein
MQIYEADRRMRHIMLSITEIVEVRMKSLIAYYHAKKFSPLGYLDINNFCFTRKGKIVFSKVNNYLNITRKADTQKNVMMESELFLKHHKENRNNTYPFWVYIEVLTMSDVSKLYALLDDDIRKNIAEQLGFNKSTRYEIIENLLHCITILRNICAHGGRLYNRLFTRKPKLSQKEKSTLRVEDDGKIIFDKLFSYILVLKSITKQKDFEIVIEHIKQIKKQYPLVDFKHYGFPDNWIDVL